MPISRTGECPRRLPDFSKSRFKFNRLWQIGDRDGPVTGERPRFQQIGDPRGPVRAVPVRVQSSPAAGQIRVGDGLARARAAGPPPGTATAPGCPWAGGKRR